MALNKGFARPMSNIKKGGMGGNFKTYCACILCKHMVMQAIGHHRASCDWPKKQWRDHKFSSYEVGRENHWT